MASFLASPSINLPLLSKPQITSCTSQPKNQQPTQPPSSSSSIKEENPQIPITPKPKSTSAESTDWIASSLTRRFGLGAGLAWVGFLTFGVVSEQIKTRFEVSQQEANTKDVEKEVEVVLPNGIRYYEMKVGGGATPKQGDLVVIDLKGKVVGNNNDANEYFVNTFEQGKRPLALVMGSRPYTKGMCEGIDYVLRSMRAGGERRAIIPPALGFGDEGMDFGDGVKIAPGSTLEFVVQMEPEEESEDHKLPKDTDSDSPLGVKNMHKFQHIGSMATSAPPSLTKNKLMASISVVIMKAKINMLLPFGPLAIMFHLLTGKHGLVFFCCLLGIVPLAERLGYATEQLAFYTGPTVGGLLNATFGNATEMIISVYAMKSGLIRVVQQSLLGSILSNMLLVLGCSFFAGGIVHSEEDQVFDKANALVNSGLLLMAVMCLALPAVLHFTHSEKRTGKSEVDLSRFSSCVMLVAYASYLFFQLSGQRNHEYSPIDEEGAHNEDGTDSVEEEEAPEITQREAIMWLVVLTIWVSILSEYLVNAIEGASESLNIPMAFISVILLPIVGNAAEHASAVMFAMKDKLDITIGVAIGSSTQIAMFVIPFCVVVGWMMGKKMDLNFQLFETASLFITVLVVAFMLQDGTAHYLKGLMLILCYVIVAASFFLHVDPSPSVVG